MHEPPPEPIDGSLVLQQVTGAIRALESVQVLRTQLEHQTARIAELERQIAGMRADNERRFRELDDRFTSVLQNQYRADNPNAPTAVNFERDELLADVSNLFKSINVVATQALHKARRSAEPVERARLISEVAWQLFGAESIQEGEVLRMLGEPKHAEDFVLKARKLRERLTSLVPTHQWNFDVSDGPIQPHQEPWGTCPEDGKVQFAVFPSYEEGTTVHQKQQVFTR